MRLDLMARLEDFVPPRDLFWARANYAEVGRALFKLLVEVAELGPDERVLDVGCGTGALLERLGLAYPDARLSGLEPVPEMLAAARRRLPASVALEAGWAEHLPFDAGQFDAVVSSSAFHYVHDPEAALSEIVRVLRPNGRLVMTDWCDDYLACRLCSIYLRLFGKAHFRAYTQRECGELLRRAGFIDVLVDRYKIGWLWGLFTATATAPAA
jgi:ubiquinone/menaquinone biosynthesis C-methylase UbiE